MFNYARFYAYRYVVFPTMYFTLRWMFKPAPWWQFWMPQSGAHGGLLFGAVVVSLLTLTGAW